MKFLTEFFLRNFKLTIVVTLFVVVFGALGLRSMNAESWPSVNFATAIITTIYPGASPEDIEALITKPIEDEIRTVSGLKDVKSQSRTGQSVIVVRIDMDNEDEEEVMDDLQKAVQRVSDLPSDLEQQPKFLELNSEEFPAIEVAVLARGPPMRKHEIADELIDELEDLPDAKNVNTTGFREREFVVALDRKRMEELHVGVNEVMAKLRSRNISIPGGPVDGGRSQKIVKLEAKVESAKELGSIVIRSNFSGQIIYLRDIAVVTDSGEEPLTLASHNGEPAVLLTINKKAGSDTLDLAADVETVLKKYRKNYGDELRLEVFNDEADRVRDKLDTLRNNALSGLGLILLFLLIFMPGRVGVVTAMSLPIGIMFTFGLMPIFGLNLNSLSILGFIIAMGNLVDNSIVISDNFINKRRDGQDVMSAIQDSVGELWKPITATAIATIAAFLPLLVTKGVMGEFIKPIPIVVTLAMLVSLIESFFLLPIRVALVGKKVKTKKEEKKENWFDRWRAKFEVLMRVILRHRYITSGICAALILSSFLLMYFANTFILFPSEQTEIYIARIDAPRGTELKTTARYVRELSQKILEVTPEWTREVTGRAGTSKVEPREPKGADGESQGLIVIYAKDFAKFNIPHTQFLAKLRELETSSYGEVTFEEQVNGPPVGDPISATFRSDDSKALVKAIDEMKEKVSAIEGVRDLRTDEVIDANEILVDLDYEDADRRGLSVSDIGTTIRAALQGIFVSDVTLENEEVNIRVKFRENFTESPSQLKEIRIMDRRGNLVPLGGVANFDLERGTPEIRRLDYKRAKTLLGSVDEEIVSAFSVNQFIKEEWSRIQERYPDVTLVFGGVEESTQDSIDSLFSAMGLALIGIFALLVFMFNSFLRPFIIMLTIPLGFIGFSVAFYLHGKPISFLALIGIVGLTGIIVNSGMVLIEFIEIARKEKDNLEEALVRASSQRLLAVLATAFSTMLGLFPTAYGVGGEDAMLIPITLAMAWGLTSGTFLTLIFIPPAYMISEEWVAYLLRLKIFRGIKQLPFYKSAEAKE